MRPLTDMRGLSSSIGFHQPYPFADQYRFDPHAVACERLPYLQRHAQFAEAPQIWCVKPKRIGGGGTSKRPHIENLRFAGRPFKVPRRHQADDLRDLPETSIEMLRRVPAEKRASTQFKRTDGA